MKLHVSGWVFAVAVQLVALSAWALEIDDVAVAGGNASLTFRPDTNWWYRAETADHPTGGWRTASFLCEPITNPASITVPIDDENGYYRLKGYMAAAAETNRLRHLGDVLERYRNAYGQYPPVDFVEYEYEDTASQDPTFRRYLDTPTGSQATNVVLFRFGLVAHLWPRMRDGLLHTNHVTWIGDTSVDLTAKAGWAGMLEFDALSTSRVRHAWYAHSFSNRVETIRDVWGSGLRYESAPPYQANTLWSLGPDRQPQTDDDIVIQTH